MYKSNNYVDLRNKFCEFMDRPLSGFNDNVL